jgi:hypothetical protein
MVQLLKNLGDAFQGDWKTMRSFFAPEEYMEYQELREAYGLKRLPAGL